MALSHDPEPETEPVTDDLGNDASSTGHRRVDAAIERLDTLDELPVDEHAAVYNGVHEELRAALTDAGLPADGSGNSS